MTTQVDSHSQARTTVQPCQLHTKHIPETHINQRHHVWPLSEGGPDIEDNVVVACATGHANIHDMINQLRMHMGVLPYSVLRRYAFKERQLAQLGYARLTRGYM